MVEREETEGLKRLLALLMLAGRQVRLVSREKFSDEAPNEMEP